MRRRCPLILLLALVANFAVGTMLVVMAYSVTYLGVLSPDASSSTTWYTTCCAAPSSGRSSSSSCW